MRLDKAILTGCDKNTEWQLPWFLNNLLLYNPTMEVVIANFGMSEEMLDLLKGHTVFDVQGQAGWFKKPQAMIQAAHYADKVVWMDTDCEVRNNISRIFDMIEEETLLIAVDRPLNKRHPHLGCQYNSGVVGYESIPTILRDWAKACEQPKQRGDQEVLHAMFGGNEILKSLGLRNKGVKIIHYVLILLME